MAPSDFDLIKHYQQFFRITIATTPEEKKMAYQLRHQVFRIDCGFDELGNLSTEETEIDEFEKNSVHVLLFNKEKKNDQDAELIGYIRLVMADENSQLGLPIESHYNDEYELASLPFISDSVSRSGKRCEISRIAIVRSYRQRQSDRYERVEITPLKDRRQKSSDNTSGKTGKVRNRRRSSDRKLFDKTGQLQQSRRFPVNYLPLCLVFAVIHLIVENDFTFAFVITEKKIMRFFSYFGIKLYSIGHPIDYNGKRSPFILNVGETIKQIKDEYRNLYDVIGSELHSSTH